jgi:hypothetical protein
MSEKASSDQSIGRPKEWQEGRYQQGGKPVDQSVIKPAEEIEQPEDKEAPVTRRDYEKG